MKTERLTTLNAVKSWLDVDNTNSDAELTRIIDAASRFIINYLNWESFKATEYTYRFTGNGKDTMLLPNWPVIDIISMSVGGSIQSAATFTDGIPGSGYSIESGRTALSTVTLYGNRFYGPGQIVYTAGFRYSETVVLAQADGAITVTPAGAGQWIDDEGVTIGGIAAVKVDGTPLAGEYSVSEWGVYTFNVADDTKTAIITYAYAPWDIAFAATEIVGEWYKRRDRIGVLSKTLGGQETVTFSKMDMNDSARASLQQYMNVVPL